MEDSGWTETIDSWFVLPRYVKRKCFFPGRTTQPPKQCGKALMLAQRFCHAQTVNGNTSRGWRLMAQMTMDPPTDFAIEPRSVKLALKNVPLGGTRTNGLLCRCLCTGHWKRYIPYAENVKWRCFCCSSVLANGDVGPVCAGTGWARDERSWPLANLWSEQLSSDDSLCQCCMDRQWQIADKDTK